MYEPPAQPQQPGQQWPQQPLAQPPYPPPGQPWPAQQYAPQPYQQQTSAPPRRAITRQKMSIGLELFHWTMIICTAGCWTPVYLAGKRKRKTVTTWS